MTFTLIRKYFLYLSQLLGFIISVYFILSAPKYDIKFKGLSWLFPETINRINETLGFIGTYVLVLPLVLIILSVINPESMSLRIMSSFFGITSTLMMIVSGWFKNTLTQVYDMKLFLITKILSLEEKRILFKQEFIRICETQYKPIRELYEDLLNYIHEVPVSFFDNQLEPLKNIIDIKDYSHQVIQPMVDNYFITIEKTIAIQNTINTNYLVTGVKVLIGIIVVSVIIRLLYDTDLFRKLAELTKAGAELSLRQTENVTVTQETVATLAKLSTEQGLSTTLAATNILVENHKVNFTTLEDRISVLETAMLSVMVLIEAIAKRIDP